MYFDTATPSSMSLSDLSNLVQTGEGAYLEFKRTVPSVYKIARELAAFANTNGGTLLVGIGDDKTIVGVEGYHEDEYLLNKAAYEICQPNIPISIEIIHYGDRDILLVGVKEAKNKPVFVYADDHNRSVYIREGDKSIAASDERVAVMQKKRSGNGVTFEYGPNEQKLFRYLKEYEKITVREFSDLINVTSNRASRILVDLVSAGVLNLLNQGKVDYFMFSNDCT